MDSLSKAFHDLATSDERSFAGTTPRDSALRKARAARARTRALQTAGGALAIGGLTVTAINAWGSPGAADPGASATNTPVLNPGTTATAPSTAPAPVSTTDVRLDTWGYQSIGGETLANFDKAFACGGPAPTPTSGRVRASLSNVSIRPSAWIVKPLSGQPQPVADANGYTADALIADTSVWTDNGEALASDVPATLVVLTKDGKIVAMVAPGRVNPRDDVRTIHTPNNGDTHVVEYGTHAQIGGEPTTFTTGYGGWGCPTPFGETQISDSFDKISYPPASDYLASGEYQAYVIARVVANDKSAAEIYVAEQGMDLWRDFDVADQAAALGWATSEKQMSGGDGTFTHVIVTVPVPDDYLTDNPLDTLVVSEPVTITIP